MIDSKLNDETGRMMALKRYSVLDSGREQNFDAITSIVCSVFEVPICAVTLVDEKRQWFKSSVGLGVSETPRENGFCDHTIQQRGITHIEDATADPKFAKHPFVTSDPYIRSYTGAPLVAPDGYQLGALCVIDRKPRSFGPEKLTILERFSGLVVDQLGLRTLAHHDCLTGALTRRAFSAEAAAAVCQHSRDGTPAALMAFDLDHFKRINDTHGHGTGDEVLKAVADVCAATLRPGDLFGRLGGEEFCVLLPATDFSSAAICAERLRREIERLAVPSGKVTASFGLAMIADHSEFDSWLAAADGALYEAKRGGRNRWIADRVERRAA